LKPLNALKGLTCTGKMKNEVGRYRWRAEGVGRQAGVEVGERGERMNVEC
jgi:hypothetical protein